MTESSSLAGVLVVHRIPGRARLRVLSADRATFDRIAQALAAHRAVHEARAAARTGSILLLHDGDLEPILAHGAMLVPFEVATAPVHAPMRRILQSIEAAEARIGEGTHHSTSLGGLTALALAGAAIYQASNGHLFPASTSLIKDALKVMSWVASREPDERPNH